MTLLSAQCRADIARIVQQSFDSRSPAMSALLERIEDVERKHPALCKFGVPTEHPLGPVSAEHAVLSEFKCRGLQLHEH